MANDQLIAMLKKGENAWNEWRLNNSTVKLDLADADLRGAMLKGFNLTYANLDRSNLFAADLEDADLSFASCRKTNFGSANLTHARCFHTNFRGADLRKANLKDAILTGADFSHAKLNEALEKFDISGVYPELPDDDDMPRSRGGLFERNKEAQKDPPTRSWDGNPAPAKESLEATRGMSADKPQKASTDLVKCSVYAPPVSTPGSQFMIQVFAHLKEEEEAVQKLAMMFDDTAQQRGTKTLNQEIERGTKLVLNLVMDGAAIDEPVQEMIWLGEAEAVQFGVSVNADWTKNNLIGSVYISQNSLPVGHVKFVVRLEKNQNPFLDAVQPESLGNWQAYKFAFISYASPDRKEVLKRVQMLSYYHTEYFQDILSLEPGQRWEKELYKNIDKADVFLLFWSKAAKESQWVMKEVLYAIDKYRNSGKDCPQIFPVIIEKPPPLPPEDLKELHFNDKMMYFIEGS